MADAIYTIFGGTGFLGRRIVRVLLDGGQRVRAATRHPERARELFVGDAPQLEAVRADVRDEAQVAAAVAGARGVANAVSLYVARGAATFQSVHVEAAGRVARAAQRAGAARFVHISGIGADVASTSPYIRSRGEGETAVRAAFAGATILRPSVMVGPDDAFLAALIGLARRLPVIPLFGNGEAALAPVHVEDVAAAAARVLVRPEASEDTYELAGPQRIRYRDLLAAICERLGKRRVLLPVPFAVWRAIALIAEFLPGPPLTRNQVELMRKDNVASPRMPGLLSLGISARPIDEVLAARIGDERTGRSGRI